MFSNTLPPSLSFLARPLLSPYLVATRPAVLHRLLRVVELMLKKCLKRLESKQQTCEGDFNHG